MPYNHVLLIDDDEDDHDIFSTALGHVAHKVSFTAIADASLALQQLESNIIHTDVIFLDLNMPVMNGQQFLYEIKKRDKLKGIPIIIFSTTSHPATIMLTREMGAHDFITKPDKFDELVYILQKVIG